MQHQDLHILEATVCRALAAALAPHVVARAVVCTCVDGATKHVNLTIRPIQLRICGHKMHDVQ